MKSYHHLLSLCWSYSSKSAWMLHINIHLKLIKIWAKSLHVPYNFCWVPMNLITKIKFTFYKDWGHNNTVLSCVNHILLLKIHLKSFKMICILNGFYIYNNILRHTQKKKVEFYPQIWQFLFHLKWKHIMNYQIFHQLTSMEPHIM